MAGPRGRGGRTAMWHNGKTNAIKSASISILFNAYDYTRYNSRKTDLRDGKERKGKKEKIATYSYYGAGGMVV